MRMSAKLLIIFAFSLLSLTSNAAAPYCNLRDPAHQIYAMFPNATSYRSIVSEINNDVRSTLNSRVPFQLHNNELGEHTLYVPVKNRKPQGIVHVRSETIDWGLAEIVWALDLDLNIKEVRFQRCRGRACKTLLDKGFASTLVGQSSEQLTSLLDGSAMLEVANRLQLQDSEINLAEAMVQSAIKTISVTRIAWPTTISDIQLE